MSLSDTRETSPTHFLEVAVEAAREAGEILVAEHSRPQTISYKGDVDIVTETDKKSEPRSSAACELTFQNTRLLPRKAAEARQLRTPRILRDIVGTLILWTARRTSRTAIPASLFRSRFSKMASPSSPRFRIRS